MIDKLYGYIDKIKGMPTLSLKDAIDQAETLTSGQQVSFEVMYEEPVYYAFTPETEGYYTLRVTPDAEHIDMYCQMYKNYESYDDAYYDDQEGAVILSMRKCRSI